MILLHADLFLEEYYFIPSDESVVMCNQPAVMRYITIAMTLDGEGEGKRSNQTRLI